MYKIGKINETRHRLILTRVADISGLPENLADFCKHGLKDKKESFLIDYIPTVEGDSVYYTLVVIIKDDAILGDIAHKMVGAIAKKIKSYDATFGLSLDDTNFSKEEKRLIRELFIHGLYEYTDYKTEKQADFGLVLEDITSTDEDLQKLIGAITLTRDITNAPANVINPATLEDIIKKRFEGIKNITTTTFLDGELLEKNMNGIHAVGCGSEVRPRLVLVEYKPNKWQGFDYAFVGKGVTFDAGGYNIKPTGYIEDMKADMAGGAVMIGAFDYLVQAEADKNIILAVPMVENLVSLNAYKPGDVITMYNKKTIEVTNTDAEGRIILADTLSYVEEKYKPTTMFDAATLTGAQVVALGTKIAAVMGRNTELNQKIQKIGYETGEYTWELPFHEAYFKAFKSTVADFTNCTGKGNPGCITAGLFLGQFVQMKNWAHIDIAGPTGIVGHSDELYGDTCTGFGVRLLIEAVLQGV